MSNKDQSAEEKDLAAKNMRLAIVLGLVALGFYVAIILFYGMS